MFPTTGLLDDFDRADGAPGANWTASILSGATSMAIASNTLTRNTGDFESNYWSAESFPADQEVWATVSTPGTGAAHAVFGRISSPGGAGLDGYWLSADATTVYIVRTLNDTHSVLGAGISVAVAAGDMIGMSMIGSLITAYRKPSGGEWGEIGSRTNSEVPGGGFIGLYRNSANGAFGDFGGGAAAMPPSFVDSDYSFFPKPKLRTA